MVTVRREKSVGIFSYTMVVILAPPAWGRGMPLKDFFQIPKLITYGRFKVQESQDPTNLSGEFI